MNDLQTNPALALLAVRHQTLTTMSTAGQCASIDAIIIFLHPAPNATPIRPRQPKIGRGHPLDNGSVGGLYVRVRNPHYNTMSMH